MSTRSTFDAVDGLLGPRSDAYLADDAELYDAHERRLYIGRDDVARRLRELGGDVVGLTVDCGRAAAEWVRRGDRDVAVACVMEVEGVVVTRARLYYDPES